MGHRRETVMRIEAYNQIAQLYNVNKPTQTSKTSRPGMGSDQVQISSLGKDMQVAKKAAAETSDIREDKVAQMKEKLANKNKGNDNCPKNEKISPALVISLAASGLADATSPNITAT